MSIRVKTLSLCTALVTPAALALAILPSTTQARSKIDDAFFQAARKADFICGLESGTYAIAKQYGARTIAEDGEKVATCLIDARESMIGALKEIPNDEPNKALRDAAKKAYSAWGPYSTLLSAGASSKQVDASPVARDFKLALSEYGTELELAD